VVGGHAPGRRHQPAARRGRGEGAHRGHRRLSRALLLSRREDSAEVGARR
jgi:hypothetical protein